MPGPSAAYVSATNTAGPGFLTAYECGTALPAASAANYQAGETRGALTIVPIDAAGRLCLYTLAAADLLVDVQGAFVDAGEAAETADAPASLRLVPVDPPQRLADTLCTGTGDTATGRRGRPAGGPTGGGRPQRHRRRRRRGGLPRRLPVRHRTARQRHRQLSRRRRHRRGGVRPLSAAGEVCVDLVVAGGRRRGRRHRHVRGARRARRRRAGVRPRPVDVHDRHPRRDRRLGAPARIGPDTIDAPVAAPGAQAVSGTITLTGPMRPGYLTVGLRGHATDVERLCSRRGHVRQLRHHRCVRRRTPVCVRPRGHRRRVRHHRLVGPPREPPANHPAALAAAIGVATCTLGHGAVSVDLLTLMEHAQPQKLYVQKAQDNLKKLENLIKDLLDVSKIQSGQLELNITEFDIDGLLDETIAALQMVTPSHDIIRKGIRGNHLIRADRQRLEQVLINLLSNAVKYSPGEKEVLVYCELTEKELIINIRDFGNGVPVEEQTNIFERFYRAKELSVYVSGFGLGLYICRDIINRHNGRIGVESGGKGSVFYFSLPLNAGLVNKK